MAQHVIMTCENHPDLRWSCKDIAVSDNGRYNGLRNIFFNGVTEHNPPQFYQDLSGLRTTYVKDGKIARECDCPSSFLTIAPEEFEVRKLREAKGK